MVIKIISGGQTGADQAALDAAIKLGIPHGGWIPKGRITENGVLDARYRLREMDTANYNRRTEQNVIDSNGTLIISHGPLTGGSEFTREMAVKHNRPCLHIDLNTTIAFHAAQKIRSWIAQHQIKVLNVAGPRASKDPKIYPAVIDILETAFYLDIISLSMTDRPAGLGANPIGRGPRSLPRSLDEAVDKLLARLSLREKTMIANVPEDHMLDLYHSLEKAIQNELRLWIKSEELVKSCQAESGQDPRDEPAAILIILKTMWHHLQKTNVLRIVK